MADTLGWRMKLGALVPSTNTSVQPIRRHAAARDHQPRPRLPHPQRANPDRRGVCSAVGKHASTMVEAFDKVLTLEPDHMILATAAESMGGVAGARVLRERLRARSGRRVGDARGRHHLGRVAPPTNDEWSRRPLAGC
jgi:maleate isomerase